MFLQFRLSFLFLFLTSAVSLASDFTISANGINSSILSQTGSNIGIGQVEQGRPGIAIDGPANRHDDVVPAEVFRLNGPPVFGDADNHGTQVAGVMISKDTGTLVGVAPDAELYASAFEATDPNGENALIANQHVASRNSGDVRAINHSYGVALGSYFLDGSSYFTLGLDWSASGHNTLHVVSGNEGTFFPLPTDNYNGMTIAASTNNGSGAYDKVASLNTYDEDADGVRTSIDLIAPGDGFPLTDQGSISTTIPHPAGTNFAAPHVTGTVALLQEFADDKLTNEQKHLLVRHPRYRECQPSRGHESGTTQFRG